MDHCKHDARQCIGIMLGYRDVQLEHCTVSMTVPQTLDPAGVVSGYRNVYVDYWLGTAPPSNSWIITIIWCIQ